jgi:hypothetical protein
MDKHLRIWVDGQLEVETSVAEDELPLDSFSSRWQEAVALAAKRGQPWRVEFGDQDADVNPSTGPRHPPVPGHAPPPAIDFSQRPACHFSESSAQVNTDRHG